MSELRFDAGQYLGLVGAIAEGKRLPDALYLHADAIPTLPEALRQIVAAAAALLPLSEPWNVLKLGTERCSLSLLWYPKFFDEGFPLLESSYAIDLESRTFAKRDYEPTSAPLLHRKERMLPAGHAAIDQAAMLTREAEELGLLEDARHIGNRSTWESKLARVGLRVEGHRLVSVHETSGESVARHRTALTRYALSTPVQSLWRHGFLDGSRSFFDYGCGRGDDVRGLTSLGVAASGWDPYFAPQEDKREADVVNLGFVLNVIEDQRERLEALRGAWTLTQRVLAVAVLISGRSAYERFRLCRDGVLTARGTFQKYFQPSEFNAYLAGALTREPIAIAPGIAFVFRHDDDEQTFLARRARGRSVFVPRVSTPRAQPETTPRPPRPTRTQRQPKWDLHADLADDFWTCCLSLGRLPELHEYARINELRELLGQPGTVLRTLLRRRGEDSFRASQAVRRNDLLVFLALNVFERRRSFSALPEAVQHDIRAHFGSYQNAQASAQQLLFSAGRPEVIHENAQRAASQGIGFLHGAHSLQLHASLAQALPPVLRVYIGCAARLYGDVETADLIKLHVQSGKVSIMLYDDFEGKALPMLIERVKINLRRQQIDFFNYGTDDNVQLLYLKSRFVGPNFPRYAEQQRFDGELSKLGVDFSDYGPRVDAFNAALAARNLRIHGFELVDALDRA